MTDLPIEHKQTAGWSGGGGSCGAECACGVVFGNFDTPIEAREQLDAHIEDERVKVPSTVDVRWLIAKLRLVLVRNEALMDLLRRYSPDSMGGTPDLFAPDCGHEVADEMNHNPWDCLDEQVRVLALDLDSEVAS